MEILHIGTLNKTTGGPSMSTYHTLKGFVQQGVNAEIYCPPFQNESIDLQTIKLISVANL